MSADPIMNVRLQWRKKKTEKSKDKVGVKPLDATTPGHHLEQLVETFTHGLQELDPYEPLLRHSEFNWDE